MFRMAEPAKFEKESDEMRRARQIRFMILALMILATVWQSAQAQSQARIGFTDADILIGAMPESKTMQQQLQTYQKKLQEVGASKESYLQAQIEDYRAKVSVLSTQGKAEMEKKIQEMQIDLQKYVAESEQNLAQKNFELMKPILTKVNDAITRVAKQKGLEIVLKHDAILYIDETKVLDITLDVGSALGITFPQK